MITLAGFKPYEQPMLPGLAAAGLPQMRHSVLGQLGEATVSHALMDAGYVVKTALAKHGDLMAVDPASGEVVHIEVKTARLDKAGRWQFCLRRVLGRVVCTDYRHADIVVLLAVRHDATCVAYIVPVAAINAGQMTISIRDAGRTKYSQFRADSITLEGIV